MPDKTIKEGLKQLDRIKVSLMVNRKDYTRYVVPDQARFRQEFLMAFMLPDFETRILLWISEDKHNDGETLFMLKKQYIKV